MNNKKKEFGQFFTTNCDYILSDMEIPSDAKLIEPFVGQGDLLKWSGRKDWEVYDIDPKINAITRDSLLNPPSYKDRYVITNPPYLASNKTKNKAPFDKWETTDLYKCFIKSFISGDAAGGIMIVPVNFLSDRDAKLRKLFFEKYKILKLNIFEERVFDDTDYTVCSIQFCKGGDNGRFTANLFPSGEQLFLELNDNNGWRLAGELFSPVKSKYKITRLKIGQKPSTKLLLRAIDTGTENGRICLIPEQEPFYGKDSDRTFCTISTNIPFDENIVSSRFNEFLEKERTKYHSLFLTNYRNSTKLYARKRIGFNLAFNIIKKILADLDEE
jgi:hypothetical protein